MHEIKKKKKENQVYFKEPGYSFLPLYNLTCQREIPCCDIFSLSKLKIPFLLIKISLE